MRRRDVSKALVASAAGAALLPRQTQAQTCTAPCYPQTAAEAAAGVTPTNTSYPPGNVFRYGAVADGVADDAPAIMRALSCNSVVFFPNTSFIPSTATTAPPGEPKNNYTIMQPIYILPSSPINLTFLGESRTATIIQPGMVDLTTGDMTQRQGINAMFVNMQANGKVSWRNLRLSNQIPGVVFTGYAISAIANGGRGSCQPIYSGSMENCWFDLGLGTAAGPGNSGFFQGGLDNFRVSNCTFEFQRGAFLLTGAGGGGDVIFTDNVLSQCTDYFIQHTDATNANIISVKGLHAYGHWRGVLFNISNASSVLIEDVVLQASNDSHNAGGIGIGTFQNCTDLQITHCNVMTNVTIGTGATSVQLTFNACTGNVSNCTFDQVDTGILITGGTNRLSFNHVDVVNSLTAAFRVNGGGSGVITASDCNWSDGQLHLATFTTTASFDFYLNNCRIVNAGLGGNSGARNLSPATSGLTLCHGCVIGQTNPSAAAQIYIDGAGTGDFVLSSPIFLGTPPLAIQNPSATQQGSMGRQAVVFSSSMTFNASYWDEFVVTADSSMGFVINAPTNPVQGKRITVMIRNVSGGTLGAVGWNSVFKMAPWTQPANANSRSIDFRYDGVNWIEVSRTPADVPT